MSVSSPIKRRKLDTKDSDDESLVDRQQLRDDLLEVLSEIEEEETFEFAVGGISKKLPPSPGIEIAGYGIVSLPVTEVTVKDLRNHFHQAPYGLGEETLIDKTIRDSWQLDPEKFEITNPKFNSGVEKLVKEIQSELDCSEQKVTSHLYKLLLYEPGGHFKPHRDTEKHPGMFATLIIQVPSIFTGGDLVVKHGAREKKIVFGTPESEFSCTYAAHYADCEHELTEITSGYRMALVYSLCWDGNGVVPSPPDIPVNKLAGLLEQIDQVLPDPCLIAWGLDHHYSENSFLNKGVQALKGGDKLIYSTLRGANALLEVEKKLDFFIVEAKKLDEMYGSCTREYEDCIIWGRRGRYHYSDDDDSDEDDDSGDDDDDDSDEDEDSDDDDDDNSSDDCFEDNGDCETEYEFKVIGSDGKPWNGSKFDLDVSKDILNVGEDDEEFWGECNEGECSGPSGNEGASKTNWYRRYVLVIFPRENAINLVYKNGLECAIDYLVQQQDSEDVSSSSGRKLANDIVELCVQQKQRFCENKKSVITMLKLISRMKELEFAKRILSLLSEPLVSYRSGSMYSWHSQQWKGGFGIPSEEMISVLKDLISAFDWQKLNNPLSRLIESCPPHYYKHAMMFLKQCPDDVPIEKLIASMVEKAVTSGGSESKLTDESLLVIGGIILYLPKSCSQFVKPFLDLPKLQNVQMLKNLLSLVEKEMGKEMTKSRLYQMTLVKYFEQLHKLSLDGSVTLTLKVDAVVKGAECLLGMQENTLLEKLVEDVLQNPNEDLLKKLLASSLGQSANVSESVKRLIVVRINQLLPIVQSGAPKLNWCQPEAVIQGHPEVQAFLRGPERSFVYHRFTGKGQATKFERDYFRGRRNATINVIGCRSDTVLEITKIPGTAKHQEALKKYNGKCEELKRLQAKIGQESGECREKPIVL